MFSLHKERANASPALNPPVPSAAAVVAAAAAAVAAAVAVAAVVAGIVEDRNDEETFLSARFRVRFPFSNSMRSRPMFP